MLVYDDLIWMLLSICLNMLASLFTVCTPATTRKKVRILQENCGVMAVLGSSANYHNMTSLPADKKNVIKLEGGGRVWRTGRKLSRTMKRMSRCRR